MANVILKPIVSKETGKTATNVEIVRSMYHTINDLVNPTDLNLTQSQRDEMESKAHKICGGSQGCKEFLEWSKQIVDEEDDVRAQQLIARTILPVRTN